MTAMTLVSTVTVGAGGASQIEWSSIPQSGKDLLVVSSLRTDRNTGGYGDGTSFRFNGDSGFNYAVQVLWGIPGDSPAAYGQSLTSRDNVNAGSANDVATTNSTFSSMQTFIANYTAASNKSLSTESVIENNGTRSILQMQAGGWAGGAITSLRLFSFNQTLQQGSTASLYIIS